MGIMKGHKTIEKNSFCVFNGIFKTSGLRLLNRFLFLTFSLA